MQLARPDQVVQLGFTGTKVGMTPAQAVGVAAFLGQFARFVGHHGLCIGADIQFDGLARAALGFEHMVMYPASGVGPKAGSVPASPGDVMRAPQPPLLRNAVIASTVDVLLATPKEEHMQLRSGTWTTVRYALSHNKPVFVVIPSGQVIPWY